jgi:hypothetical protein
LLTLRSGDIYALFGGDGRHKLESYPHYASARGCEWLEAVAQFIGYDLLDDGDPGIGYLRFDLHQGGFVACPKDHEDAKPYFHLSVEYLRKTVPDAAYLDVERALEVLDWYETRLRKDRKQMQAQMRRAAKTGRFCIWTEDDLADFDPRPEQLALAALADELTDP